MSGLNPVDVVEEDAADLLFPKGENYKISVKFIICQSFFFHRIWKRRNPPHQWSSHAPRASKEAKRVVRGGTRILRGFPQDLQLHRKLPKVQEQGDHRQRSKPSNTEETAQVRVGCIGKSLSWSTRGSKSFDSIAWGTIWRWRVEAGLGGYWN